MRQARLTAYAWLKDFQGPPPKKTVVVEGSQQSLLNLLQAFFEREGMLQGKTLDCENALQLVQRKLQSVIIEDPIFTDYLKSFWDWESSSYVKDKIECGQRISRQYVRANHGFVVRYAIPFFKAVRLSGVTPSLLEKFKASLPRVDQKGDGLSPRTVNAVLGCIGTALEEAVRLGWIPENPARKLRKLALNTTRRGVLSEDEVKKVFSLHWPDQRCKVASLLAACHGLRAGEVGALQICDVDCSKGVIIIRHSWERSERKLKTPKNGNTRSVFTAPEVINELMMLHEQNPHGNQFIFWNSEKTDEPMNLDNFRDALQEALVASGIGVAEQKQRKIDFHSWRHFSNSVLRGRVSDAVLQKAMGHQSTEMTDRYYHLTDEQGMKYRESVVEVLIPLVCGSDTARGQ